MASKRNAREVLAHFDAHYRHLRKGRVSYIGAVTDQGDHVDVTPLSLEGIEDGDRREVDTELAVAIGRALGMAGYVPNPDYAGETASHHALQSGGTLALRFQAPGREPDGTARMMAPAQGCLVCDCGPWGCACW